MFCKVWIDILKKKLLDETRMDILGDIDNIHDLALTSTSFVASENHAVYCYVIYFQKETKKIYTTLQEDSTFVINDYTTYNSYGKCTILSSWTKYTKKIASRVLYKPKVCILLVIFHIIVQIIEIHTPTPPFFQIVHYPIFLRKRGV